MSSFQVSSSQDPRGTPHGSAHGATPDQPAAAPTTGAGRRLRVKAVTTGSSQWSSHQRLNPHPAGPTLKIQAAARWLSHDVSSTDHPGVRWQGRNRVDEQRRALRRHGGCNAGPGDCTITAGGNGTREAGLSEHSRLNDDASAYLFAPVIPRRNRPPRCRRHGRALLVPAISVTSCAQRGHRGPGGLTSAATWIKCPHNAV